MSGFDTQAKVLSFENMVAKVAALKDEGRFVVQSHGVFDFLHPGITGHLEQARAQGDVLVVTVIRDRDVRRGPGRPVFSEDLRAEAVAALAMVDWVCLVDDDVPFESVRRLQPSGFAKGQSYRIRDRKIHSKIFEEERDYYFEKTKILETEGFHFSSTGIVNQFLDMLPEATKSYLRGVGEAHPFEDIVAKLDALKKMRVLVVGDAIVDEYHYVTSQGMATKDHLVVGRYQSHEVFAGGTLAVANHLAGICDQVDLVTVLGAEDSREEFIRQNLRPEVSPRFFVRGDGPTVIKKRYLHEKSRVKLFEVNFLNDDFLQPDLEQQVAESLGGGLSDYDLVCVCDFGHGLVSPKIIQVLEGGAKKLAVNAQTNSANRGYNLITRYSKAGFTCVDQGEGRLATRSRFAGAEEVARNLKAELGSERLMLTLGAQGLVALGAEADAVVRAPVLTHRVVDAIGAGDALFAYAAPCYAADYPLALQAFLGSAVGALATQVVCNKRAIQRHEVLDFVHALLK